MERDSNIARVAIAIVALARILESSQGIHRFVPDKLKISDKRNIDAQ